MSSNLSKEQFEDLLDNVIGVTKRNPWKGSKCQFNCPIHHESNPSCGVNLDYSPELGKHYQVFNCFSCGASGTIPWLLFKSLPDQFKNLRKAEEFLEARYGVNFNYIYEEGEIKIRLYEDRFISVDSERKVFPRSNIAPYQSGKETFNYFFMRGFNNPDLKRFMIGRDLKHKTVTIPVFWEDGQLAGMIGRYITKRPKNMRYKIYWNFEKGKLLYPLNDFMVSNDTIICVESMLDVIMMKHWGYENALAIMGVFLSKEQSDILARKCKKVILLFDNDERGLEALEKARAMLKDRVQVLIPTYYPDKGKDPSEWGERETQLVIDSASLVQDIPLMI